MKYLYPTQLLYLYKRIMEQAHSSGGMRDMGLLESAVYRPRASFGGKDLYPDLFLKSAALIHSIIRNHPFIDGNKRTGFEAMRLMLRINGYDIKASVKLKYEFVLKIVNNRTFDVIEIAKWIQKYSHKI